MALAAFVVGITSAMAAFLGAYVLMCFLFQPLIALVNGYMFSLVMLSLAPMERGLCIIAI